MFLLKTRKHYRHMRRFAGLFTANPVLSLGLALPFAVAAAYSLQSAAILIIGMGVVTLPVTLLASLLKERVPFTWRIPLYSLVSMALLIPVENWLTGIFPVPVNALGLYLPILAVNTLTINRCEKVAVRRPVPQAMASAALNLLGFAAVLAVAAAIRELFGAGTLWGVPIQQITFKLPGLGIPFGGCFVLAFLAAGAKYGGRLLRAGYYRSDLRRQQEALPAPGPQKAGQ